MIKKFLAEAGGLFDLSRSDPAALPLSEQYSDPLISEMVAYMQENITKNITISDFLGFSSSSYFYYTFKKITNVTPTQYFKSVHQYDFEK